MDDVLAISCFTILLGITFHTSDNTEEGTSMLMLLLHAPLEIVVAVVFGLCWGLIITYLPAQPDPSPILRSQSKSTRKKVVKICWVLFRQVIQCFVCLKTNG